MKHIAFRAVCLIFVVYFLVSASGCSSAGKNETASAQGPAGANWKRYRYAADKFSVEFPGEPQAKPNDNNTGTRYFTSLENDNFAYFVERAQLPADLDKTPEQIFEGYVNGAAGGTNSQVKNQRPISMCGDPGREFVLENEKMIMRFRLYLLEKTIYQVLVLSHINIS